MKKLLTVCCFIAMLTSFANEDGFESGRGSRIAWARLKYPVKGASSYESAWDWQAHPTGDLQMIDQIRKFTSINISEDWNTVDVEELEKMCSFPFIFMHGQRPENISAKGKENLKEYLLRGGFLFVDDCVLESANPQFMDLLYQSILRMFKEFFPGVEIRRVGMNHELFNCYYKIRFYPHCQGKNNGMSLVTYQGRLIAVVTSSDIHCAWVNKSWFGERMMIESYRMGTNILVYSMLN